MSIHKHPHLALHAATTSASFPRVPDIVPQVCYLVDQYASAEAPISTSTLSRHLGRVPVRIDHYAGITAALLSHYVPGTVLRRRLLGAGEGHTEYGYWLEKPQSCTQARASRRRVNAQSRPNRGLIPAIPAIAS